MRKDVYCDSCQQPGLREKPEDIAPIGWLYRAIQAPHVAGMGRSALIYIRVCSVRCACEFWRRGPGDRARSPETAVPFDEATPEESFTGESQRVFLVRFTSEVNLADLTSGFIEFSPGPAGLAWFTSPSSEGADRFVIQSGEGFYAGPVGAHTAKQTAPPRWVAEAQHAWSYGSEKAARELISARRFADDVAWVVGLCGHCACRLRRFPCEQELHGPDCPRSPGNEGPSSQERYRGDDT